VVICQESRENFLLKSKEIRRQCSQFYWRASSEEC